MTAPRTFSHHVIKDQDDTPPWSSADSRLPETATVGSRDGDNVALIVGPQGDFTAAELDAIMSAGAQPLVCLCLSLFTHGSAFMSMHRSQRARSGMLPLLSGFSGHRYLLFVALIVQDTMLGCALP